MTDLNKTYSTYVRLKMNHKFVIFFWLYPYLGNYPRFFQINPKNHKCLRPAKGNVIFIVEEKHRHHWNLTVIWKTCKWHFFEIRVIKIFTSLLFFIFPKNIRQKACKYYTNTNFEKVPCLIFPNYCKIPMMSLFFF